ncbi:MAG: hypothetical protein ACI942_003099, partial [Planctomycetota bacterium]
LYTPLVNKCLMVMYNRSIAARDSWALVLFIQ